MLNTICTIDFDLLVDLLDPIASVPILQSKGQIITVVPSQNVSNVHGLLLPFDTVPPFMLHSRE